MPSRLLAIVLLLTALPCFAIDDLPPTLAGFVTRVASPTDFDVNGQHILVGPKTTFEYTEVLDGNHAYVTVIDGSIVPFLGEAVEVYGRANNKKHTITAARFAQVRRDVEEVSGVGLVDAILKPSQKTSPNDSLVRADGYSILITPKTTLKFDKPLSSISDLQPNVWLSYHGKLQLDGTVWADKVSLTQNTVSKTVEELRRTWDWDITQTAAENHQSTGSRMLRGIDPSNFPLYPDAAMQQRVTRVGDRLLPRFQAALPAADATRLNFRFFVVDSAESLTIWPLPSSIILIPHTAVERMQNDDQLAALLAGSMAALMEGQSLVLPTTNKQLGVSAAVTAAEILIPGVGLGVGAVSIPLAIKSHELLQIYAHQRARVALTLLHDAGFDLSQAPVAYWLIATKSPKNLAETPLPKPSLELYHAIDQLWNPASAKPELAEIPSPVQP